MSKISVGEAFTVSINSAIEKIWISGGGVSRIFDEISLSHSAENLSTGDPFVFG